LNDPYKRGIYDIYGEAGLRNGIKDLEGNLKGGYKYSGNAEAIFEKFFGTTNPFAVMKDYDRLDRDFGSLLDSGFGGLNQPENAKLKDVEANLECSLEELYNGCVKTLVYRRIIINPDGRTTSEQEDSKDIEIFKGYGLKTTIKYPGLGNESPGMPNSDLIVKIKEKVHKNFSRKNNDLLYIHKISLVDALNSELVHIKALDDRNLIISMDEIINPQTIKVVKKEGMPIYDENDPLQNILFNEKKGDLIIKFDIYFPKIINNFRW